ncbi:hypothetical protein TFLX_04075 [Thermoflexales bacterium]|nr:hypothetical protein TFLX_04075 [Thermoflexales bacterium]
MGHSDEPTEYEIRVRGGLLSDYAHWFGEMAVTIAPQAETIIRGKVTDQAALHGLLAAIRDLNMTLLLVRRIETEIQDN